jgi:hypothetical protein
MRTLLCMLVFATVACPSILAAGQAVSLVPQTAMLLPSLDEPPCNGTLLLNADESWENGWAWDLTGNVAPDFGGFGEGYEADGTVCGIQLHLSTLPNLFQDQTADVYIYESDGTHPSTVLSVKTGIVIEEPAQWPGVSTYEIEIAPTAVSGAFFVYVWGDFAGDPGWYVAADLNGPGGMPRTKIAPGTPFPEGWQDVNAVWGGTAAMGIGAYIESEATPNESTTWGEIKTLFK